MLPDRDDCRQRIAAGARIGAAAAAEAGARGMTPEQRRSEFRRLQHRDAGRAIAGIICILAVLIGGGAWISALLVAYIEGNL